MSTVDAGSLPKPAEIGAGKKEDVAIVKAVNGSSGVADILKPVGNGVSVEVTMNGQDEKSGGDAPHREVPGLLPLASAAVSPQSGAAVTAPNTARQQPPPLLPMSTAAAPVIATKSAPPPLPAPAAKGKAGRISSSPLPSVPQRETRVSVTSSKQLTEDAAPPPEKEPKKRKVGLKKRHSIGSSDSMDKDPESGGDGDGGRKSKRARTKTQPFQSSDIDTNLLRVIKATAAAALQQKAGEDKLVVFWRGEFLAVRNAEGGFYICQAMQNIYRGSHKIRIRWLSQVDAKEKKASTSRAHKSRGADDEPVDESGFDVYTPDFYDNTDFECILTNLELEKLGKDRFGLPVEERQRTENILRRAIEVERGGVENLELTEEHPDGLDVSLFHDESQLKRKRRKGKDDSSETSDSEKEDEMGTASASSVTSTEPEPSSSGGGGASTSTGRGTKRTREAALAAARRKIQMAAIVDDDDDDDDDDQDSSDDDDAEQDDDDSSSDSGAVKRRRGRSSPRARPAPTARPRAKRRSPRAAKKSPTVVHKTPPAPTSKRTQQKSPARKSTCEIVKSSDDSQDSLPSGKRVVTVDVEMVNDDGKAASGSASESAPEVKASAEHADKAPEQQPKEEKEPEKPDGGDKKPDSGDKKPDSGDKKAPPPPLASEEEEEGKKQDAPAPLDKEEDAPTQAIVPKEEHASSVEKMEPIVAPVAQESAQLAPSAADPVVDQAKEDDHAKLSDISETKCADKTPPTPAVPAAECGDAKEQVAL